LIARKFTSD